jgi:nucleotide-binding universal stress UspA family protein
MRSFELATPKDHICFVGVLHKHSPREKSTNSKFAKLFGNPNKQREADRAKRDELVVPNPATYEERKSIEQMLNFCSTGMPQAQAFKGTVSYRCEEGDIREMIMFAAIAENTDYIVVGGRGDSGVKNPRHIGSTTDYLVRNAPCSVVVVKAPVEE